MSTSRTKTIAEIGLAIALFAVLQLLFRFVPAIAIAGGSITIGMLPIFVVALRRGLAAGLITGILCGFTDMLVSGLWAVHPIQVVLDYPVAFGLVGLAGVASRPVHRLLATSKTALAGVAIVLGVVLGGAGRFAAAFTSGIVFWGSNAPEGQPVWLYSATYNLSYLLPSTIACAVLAAILVPVLARVVPADAQPLEGGFNAYSDSQQRA